ncbi:MAG TPA: hypothetical protein VFE50_21265 [Cyclobacteriaceae bacterium]|nr:hypothetical protein [Cyclobacteriaceae bacterium]
MRNLYPRPGITVALFAIAVIATVAAGCRSGKSAYKHGDYYSAVLQAVDRLRSNPDHKKSKEILSLSYQAAVDYLETDAQNQIASNANFKYRAAVGNYEKINNLYDQIRKSPGALKVIPTPVNRYKELTEYKAKAAEESYDAGIQALMLNTRQDSKNAYFLFTDANNFSPGFRESIEMMEQAKANATVNVVVEPALDNRYSWNFEPTVFGYNSNMFVKFYTPRQAEEQGVKRVDQFLKVSVNGYSEGLPQISRRTETRTDSVKNGEKTVNGKKIDTYQKITSTTTIFEKKATSHASINLWITDAASKADISKQEITSSMTWSDSWAIYTGDIRAVAAGNKKLIEKREPNMGQGYLQNITKKDLDEQLAKAISGYYSQF